jgi:hypothetical protein
VHGVAWGRIDITYIARIPHFEFTPVLRNPVSQQQHS